MSGRGEYAVVRNSLIEGGHNVVPSFGNNQADVVLTNMEYVRDVYCPLTLNAFQVVDSIPLNPGLGESFPWLSQVAMNYEEYEFEQLIVTFKSTIDQSLATNGQTGQIALTTSYNPGQDPFGSKQEMMSYSGGMSCKTNQSMQHGVECDPSKNSGSAGKYVRPGTIPQADLKNYDLGTTYLSILDAPTQFLGVTLGELWITYTVRLRKPKLTVGENYNVGRVQLCSGTQPAGNFTAFGIEGDLSCNVSVKSTMPVTFERPPDSFGTTFIPLTVGGQAGDVISYWQPFTYTSTPNLPWDLKVIFPPWFNGIVRLKRLVALRAVTGTDSKQCVAVSFGQIFRFPDLPLRRPLSAPGLQPQLFTHIMNVRGEVEGDSASAYIFNTQSSEMHLRVLPSNNGVENCIYFASGSTLTTTATISYNAYFEIEGINSYLSVDDAPIGPKARVLIEELSSPGVITTWP